LEENGDLDLVEIWKNGSKTGQKHSRIFSSTFLSCLGRDNSSHTPFDAVGLILSSTHPLPSQNWIKKNQIKKKWQKNHF